MCSTPASGIRLAVASSAATVDALSNGRLVLGLGAGHTPTEWTMSGLRFPPAWERVERLAAGVRDSGAERAPVASSLPTKRAVGAVTQRHRPVGWRLDGASSLIYGTTRTSSPRHMTATAEARFAAVQRRVETLTRSWHYAPGAWCGGS
jgi:alkanesulfonate monooxygenase SsuD/methylene tetrahydromethanopterin reductase-like flavin-dependent oxidoreductase (luciferase family)